MSPPKEITELAMNIRRQVLRMTHRARSCHVGSCFSMADLLAVLYSGVLQVRSSEPNWPARDRLIVSKGHAVAAVYAVLAEKGFIPGEKLESFYQDGSTMPGHVTASSVPGIELSTGSLGHGLAVACGMAFAAAVDGNSYRIFALLSDGECDEGSTWESVLFAPHHHLDNLIAIVDYNKIQSLARTDEILSLEPFAAKWRAFGWSVREVDGHDVAQIYEALATVPWNNGRPSCMVAHTIKGKGVSFMEDSVLWHYRPPDAVELERALAELEAGL